MFYNIFGWFVFYFQKLTFAIMLGHMQKVNHTWVRMFLPRALQLLFPSAVHKHEISCINITSHFDFFVKNIIVIFSITDSLMIIWPKQKYSTDIMTCNKMKCWFSFYSEKNLSAQRREPNKLHDYLAKAQILHWHTVTRLPVNHM